MLFVLKRVVPRIQNLVPLWDGGFLFWKKTELKEDFLDARAFKRTAKRSVGQNQSSV